VIVGMFFIRRHIVMNSETVLSSITCENCFHEHLAVTTVTCHVPGLTVVNFIAAKS